MRTIGFSTRQNETYLWVEAYLRDYNENHVDVFFSPRFIKVSYKGKYLTLDLSAEIDFVNSKVAYYPDLVLLTCTKKIPNVWKFIQQKYNSREERLDERRESYRIYHEHRHEQHKKKRKEKLEQQRFVEMETYRNDYRKRCEIERKKKQQKKEALQAIGEHCESSAEDVPEHFFEDKPIPPTEEEITWNEIWSKGIDTSEAVLREEKENLPKLVSEEEKKKFPSEENLPELLREKDEKPNVEEYCKIEELSSDEEFIEIVEPIKKNFVNPPTKEEVPIRKNEVSSVMILDFSEKGKPGIPLRETSVPIPEPCPIDIPRKNLKYEDELSSPFWLKDRGDSLLLQDRLDEALDAYTQSLQEEVNPLCFANRSLAHFFSKNYKLAIDDSLTCLNLMETRNKRKFKSYGRALYGLPENNTRFRLFIRIGTCQLYQGDFSSSLTNFEEAVKIVTSESQLHCYLEILQKDIKKIKIITESFLHKKKLADFHLNEESLEIYDELIKKCNEANSPCIVLYSNKSLSQTRLKQFDEAVETIDLCLKEIEKILEIRVTPAFSAYVCLPDPVSLKTEEEELREKKEKLRDRKQEEKDRKIKMFRAQKSDFEKTKIEDFDWLMKRPESRKEDLPSIPQEFEWVRNLHSKSDDYWIARRRIKSGIEKEKTSEKLNKFQITLDSQKVDEIVKAIEFERQVRQSGATVCLTETQIQEGLIYVGKLRHYEEKREKRIIELYSNRGVLKYPTHDVFLALKIKLLSRKLQILLERDADSVRREIIFITDEILHLDRHNVFARKTRRKMKISNLFEETMDLAQKFMNEKNYVEAVKSYDQVLDDLKKRPRGDWSAVHQKMSILKVLANKSYCYLNLDDKKRLIEVHEAFLEKKNEMDLNDLSQDDKTLVAKMDLVLKNRRTEIEIKIES